MGRAADGGAEARAATGSDGAYSPRQRVVAVAYGIACHSLFAVAIGTMIFSLATGLRPGLGPFRGVWSHVANAWLVIQFPFVHSWLLSRRGSQRLARLAPLGLGRDLGTTTFALIASLQLLVTFGLWSPSQIVWWRAEGTALALSLALYAASWLLLLAAMNDAGLDVQSGFRGWGCVALNRRPSPKPFPTGGLYRYTRQPVYVAFFLTLWTGPVWTPDRLMLALGWTAYCVFGPLLKERRYRRFHPDRYPRYQASVPYWIPSLRACELSVEVARHEDR